MKLPGEFQSIESAPGRTWSEQERSAFINWVFGQRYAYFCAIALKALGPIASWEDARDALGEFAVRRLDGVIASFDPQKGANPATYLAACLVNYCRTARTAIVAASRRQSTINREDPQATGEFDADLDFESEGPGPEQQAFERECAPKIICCLKRLPARSRELVMRHYFAYEEINCVARAASMTPGHVRVQLHRAREALKRCLVAKGIDEELLRADQ